MAFLMHGEARALELGRPLCFDPNVRLERWPSADEAGARATESWGAVA